MNIRTVDLDGEIYIVGSDLVKELGYKNAVKTIMQHCNNYMKVKIQHPQSKDVYKKIEVLVIDNKDALRLVCKSECGNEDKMNLISFIENLRLIDSREVSDMINIRHYDLLRKIEGQNGKIVGLISVIKEEGYNVDDYFKEKYYLDKTNRKLKCYDITKKGCEVLIHSLRKNNNITDLIKYIGKFDNPIILNERMEIKFLDQLEDVLKPLGIEGQRQCSIDNKYRIDFYISSLNLAIEYDEAQHNTLTNQSKDTERQSYIEDKLGCNFVRCDYRNTDAYNIGLVMKEIINR